MTANHGKNRSDAANKQPRHCVKKGAKYGVTIGKGVRALVLYLAKNMAFPAKVTGVARRKWNTMDKYVVVSIPVTAFNERRFRADGGYSGSSKDHFYASAQAFGRGVGLDNVALVATNLPCPGDCCLHHPLLNDPECKFKQLRGKRRVVRIEPATVLPAAVLRRGGGMNSRMTIEQFAMSLPPPKPVRRCLCVVRVAEETDGQQYWLARPRGKAYQLEEPYFENVEQERAGIAKYDIGWWVVNIRWFSYQRTDSKSSEREFKLTDDIELWSVGGFIRLSFADLKWKTCKKNLKNIYVLSDEMHTKILRYGNIIIK
jgi:hypothetical protein